MRSATATFVASPPVTLSGVDALPSPFNDDPQSDVDFYGSARLGDPTFANDFSVDVLFTDPNDEGGAALSTQHSASR